MFLRSMTLHAVLRKERSCRDRCGMPVHREGFRSIDDMNAKNLIGNDSCARATSLYHERVARHISEQCVRATFCWRPRCLARNLFHLVRDRMTVGRVVVGRVAESDGKCGTICGPRLREDIDIVDRIRNLSERDAHLVIFVTGAATKHAVSDHPIEPRVVSGPGAKTVPTASRHHGHVGGRDIPRVIMKVPRCPNGSRNVIPVITRHKSRIRSRIHGRLPKEIYAD